MKGGEKAVDTSPPGCLLFFNHFFSCALRSIIIGCDGSDGFPACSDLRTVDFHSLSCCPLFVPDSISSSVVMRFLSLAPACHCFKPRGTPRHDVKFKCCSLGQAFRAFLKRETESERKEENDHLRVEMSWNHYYFYLLVNKCVPYFELAGDEIEAESK